MAESEDLLTTDQPTAVDELLNNPHEDTSTPGGKTSRGWKIAIIIMVIIVIIGIIGLIIYFATRPAKPGGGCTANSDCQGDQICRGGVCVNPACTTSADCGGYPCTNNVCNKSCDSDTTCINGDRCLDGICGGIKCSKLADCVYSSLNIHGDMYCDTSKKRCERLSDTTCISNSQCPIVNEVIDYTDGKQTYKATRFHSMCANGSCAYGYGCTIGTDCVNATKSGSYYARASADTKNQIYTKGGVLSIGGSGINLDCVNKFCW